MKQILQNLGTGRTETARVPAPGLRAGHVHVQTLFSLISPGTERMLISFGKAGWVNKVRQQPDKVRQVLDKIRTDGLLPTIGAVRSKLDQPVALGYCNVGSVVETGTPGFATNDRVVSNGPHAQCVCVPENLCARVPDEVSDEDAAFTVVGAIGLQGIRLAQPTLGEAFAVSGLGLIGLLTVQLLRAHGCRVLGIDYDPFKLELARRFGAETVDLSREVNPVFAGERFSRGRGMDGVIITATTKSSDPVHQAALMCRKRGRIVLVGVTGLELSRDDFYKKELSFQVSCSYGPGRYDPEYERKGNDYPVGYVRWTEQRNFEAVLDMMASGAINVKPLITHRFPFEQAESAYGVVEGQEPSLGILLEYPENADRDRTERFSEVRTNKSDSTARLHRPSAPVVSFIGAGNYAGRVLMPAFKKGGAILHCAASAGGVSASHYGKKFGFAAATTDTAAVFCEDVCNTVAVCTRHDSHAGLVCKALEAGKNVFTEKPLCLTLDELAKIESTYAAVSSRRTSAPILMVGFNRRFSSQVQKMKELLLSLEEPKTFVATVNAGQIPQDHWTQDPAIGGGRIIGEACHFVDLLRFLAGASITGRQALYLGRDRLGDKALLTLKFEDGSIGSIHYLANGHRSFPKERVEVFCSGRVLQLDNFRKLKGYGWPKFKKMNLWRQDKGQDACAAAFLDAVRHGRSAPISFDEIVEVSRTAIELASGR